MRDNEYVQHPSLSSLQKDLRDIIDVKRKKERILGFNP
jgi:hypothetical protein